MAGSAAQLPKSESVLRRFAQRRPLTLFFLLAYVWTWSVLLLMAAILSGGRQPPAPEIFFNGMFALAVSGPTVAAIVTSWLAYHNLRICHVWTGWRGLLLGLAFGLAAFFVTTVVAPTHAIVKSPFSAMHWVALLHWSTYGLNFSTFFGGPVNEEPGWRGFALPRLQARYGPVLATLILAPLWAAWHTPLFWMEGWTTATPWEFLLILLGVSFLLTAAANIAKFNVLVAMALHVFFNKSGSLGNTLSAGLPRRAHEMVIYTLAVFAWGFTIGMAALVLNRRAVKRSDFFPIGQQHAEP